ncbi:MAG: SMC family ATPase [Chloroflexi bacterium]|nr:SMC family ATPase [Chloroflexota bacterium]
MIPVRLALRNFLSYADDCPPLIFDGFRLACLAGDNGHGKSAILDAMTWALWGKARTNDDDLVHQGRTEMEVDFEFLLGDTRYRVIRKRVRPRRERGAGQTVLDLQIGGTGGFRSIAGNAVRETEKKVVDILRMPYETFINSAFLVQGRADEFTLKAPADRKRVLGDILGLAIYDELERRARDCARERDAALRELKAAIDQIDRELQTRPQHEEELRRLLGEIEMAQARADAAQAAYQAARDRQALAAERRRRLVELQRDVADAERECRQVEAEVLQRRRRVEQYDAILARRTETLDGFGRLTEARQRSEALSALAQRQAALTERRRQLQRVVDEAKHRLVGDREASLARLELHRKRIADGAGFQAELVESRRLRAALDDRQQELDALRKAQEEVVERIQMLRADNTRFKEEMESLADRIRRLGGDDARCPLCETELGVDGKRRLRETLNAEGQHHKGRYRENEAQVRTLTDERTRRDREIQQMEQRLTQERRRLDGAIGSLEARLGEAEQAAAAAARDEAVMAEIDRRLSAGEFARDEQLQLGAVLEELQTVRYDADEHRRMVEDTRRLAEYEERHRQLAMAESSVEQERESLSTAQALLERRSQRRAELVQRHAELGAELKAMGDVDAEVGRADAELREASARLRDRLDRRARVQQQIDSCERLEAERQQRLAEQQEAAKEKGIYEELAVAFGKKGIQAMIIETALPEIELEANTILSRMTDSRMHVTIESQRDSKKGDTIETLDINIGDDLGTRSYESFSGGEKFRVNFAIRIGLSKLLARRAGARLQTLVVDEGFGTQDAGGREKLVEAISTIQDDFEKILVITHIDELKDQFPVRIEVTKTAEGSTFVLA